MKKIILLALLPLSLTLNAEVASDLVRCTKIENNENRLDCFDTVANYYKNNISTSNAPSTANVANTEVNHNNVLKADSVTISKVDAFGKSILDVSELESIKARIEGEFKGWRNGEVLKLSNGQKWKVTSRSAGYVKLLNPEVEISKGFMGSYNIKINGLNSTAKVKRID